MTLYPCSRNPNEFSLALLLPVTTWVYALRDWDVHLRHWLSWWRPANRTPISSLPGWRAPSWCSDRTLDIPENLEVNIFRFLFAFSALPVVKWALYLRVCCSSLS